MTHYDRIEYYPFLMAEEAESLYSTCADLLHDFIKYLEQIAPHIVGAEDLSTSGFLPAQRAAKMIEDLDSKYSFLNAETQKFFLLAQQHPDLDCGKLTLKEHLAKYSLVFTIATQTKNDFQRVLEPVCAVLSD